MIFSVFQAYRELSTNVQSDEINKLKVRYEQEIQNLENKISALVSASTKKKEKIERIFKEFSPKSMSELDVPSFSAFTSDNLFGPIWSIYKRNVEKLGGLRRFHLHTIRNQSISEMNRIDASYNYTPLDFHIGLYRVKPFFGYEYRLYFKRNSECCQRVYLSDFQNRVDIRPVPGKHVINLIMPLWGDRANSLAKFMRMFEANAKEDGFQSTLTIVYVLRENQTSIETGWKDSIERFINSFKRRTSLRTVKLIYLQSKFYSRARALQIGVENCCADSRSLLFICDVDVVFNTLFLDMCRLNAELNRTVFYPILYSIYNPTFNSETDRAADKDETNFTLGRDRGFWRDFGFGMTCQYKQDFLDINGFSDIGYFVEGWGDEDLYLYRKYINSHLDIVRAITPGIFHVYHQKYCNKSELNKQQYAHCLESKILNEASHRSFGLKYFNINQADFK
jgi:chondroitin sulfate N-acetylgalactosaminyltransferase 1/2